MDRGETWQVRLIGDDALLFSLTPDGTVVMRAVPRADWEARLAESEGRKRPISHVIDEIVHPDRALSPA